MNLRERVEAELLSHNFEFADMGFYCHTESENCCLRFMQLHPNENGEECGLLFVPQEDGDMATIATSAYLTSEMPLKNLQDAIEYMVILADVKHPSQFGFGE